MKKILVTLLVLMTIICFASCGNNNSNPVDTKAETSPSTKEAITTVEEVTTMEEATTEAATEISYPETGDMWSKTY